MVVSEKKGISLFEFVLGSFGFFVIFGIILLGAGLGILFGLPYAVTGVVVGLITAWAIISGSFAGTVIVKCSDCGNKQRVTIGVGSYQCTKCSMINVVKKKEPEVNLYSAFPTD